MFGSPRIALSLLSLCFIAAASLAPFGIAFAQTATSSATATEDTATSTPPATPTPTTARAAPIRDTYRKEPLPNKAVFSDIVVGPGRFDLELAPGESRTVELTVSNRMGDRRLIRLTTEDAGVPGDGEASIQLLGDEIGPYTLKDYISVPHERFWLDHGHRARIPVTVSIPEDAEPGGFYGSMITQIVSNPDDREVSGIAGTNVLVTRVATLFFVKTPGQELEAGQLVDFDTVNSQRFFTTGPIDFSIAYENTGSVHLTPSAEIVIRNMLGEQVSTIQADAWYVLPSSLRTREISWNRDVLLGRYTIDASVYRGYNDLVDTERVVIWVFPWKYVLLLFGGLLVFFLIIRFFTSRFELKRKP